MPLDPARVAEARAWLGKADALVELQGVCQEIGVDLVGIGAIAARVCVVDEHRTAEDVDAGS